MTDLLLVCAYLAAAVVAYAGICGDFDWHCRNRWQNICDSNMARQHMGFAAAIGLIAPIGLPASFFATGFYQHGFKLYVEPDHV